MRETTTGWSCTSSWAATLYSYFSQDCVFCTIQNIFKIVTTDADLNVTLERKNNRHEGRDINCDRQTQSLFFSNLTKAPKIVQKKMLTEFQFARSMMFFHHLRKTIAGAHIHQLMPSQRRITRQDVRPMTSFMHIPSEWRITSQAVSPVQSFMRTASEPSEARSRPVN